MIIDEFGLSPIQEGMLFHHLSGDAPGVDIEQIVIGYDEPVDAVLLERAWQLTVERHPALRASFEWKQSSDPVQRVHDRVDLRLEVQADGEDETGFQEFLARDRAFGFDLSQAPLMRLTLFDYGKHRYRLVWTVHHILLDGRAFILVLNDVEEFYQRLRRGETVVAEPGPAFRPYIEWLQSLDLKDASQFWADRLRGLAGPTPLLEDAQAPGGAFRGYGEEELRLSEKTTLALREAAKRYDITLNTIVMGVWGLLLGRYSGEQDVLFGATKTTRRGSIAGADAVAGLFLNTIPVRANLPPETTIAAMLQELRAQWLGLRTYEHTPLTRIKEASGFTPSAALFDSLVVFENQSFLTALRATSACWEKREWHLLEQNNFPLTFAVYGDPEMLLRLEFDRRKFTYETAQRMLRHARQLFEGIAANPEQKIAELTLLTPAEREQLLVEWNYTKQEYPRRCVHEMFEEQVESTPDSVALVFENQCLTYRELNARANRLANYLRRLGVGPEDLVALYAERSLDMVVGLIGILKAGGAYLPIDTVYPKDRIGFMLEDAKVGVLVTQESLLASLGEPQARVVCLDTEWKTIEQESPENLSLNVGPDNLAYVIYTSGSTGKPKGCLMTHYNVARLMEATDPWFHFGESDVWTLFHSHAFDFSVWEIWGALLYGGRLVVVPYWVSRDPGLFLQLLRNQRVTVLNQTPSAFRQLIQADEAAGGTDLSLRVVIFGGEALELQSLRPWFDRHGDQRPQLVNMYGITETTVHVTYRPLSLEDVLEGRGSVIGRPIPDLRLYILDPQRQPTPIGVPGEIYVGGAGVARGYLHRPELTKERFIDNPFSTQSDDRLYRSGDLARRLANGDIEYLGRIDLQVKIRGFRIELGEIEAALKKHPEINQAVVVAREDTPGDKRLVAYYTTALTGEPEEDTLSVGRLRSHLSASLPDYMVPAAYVRLESLHLTSNGKLDRKALPVPDATMQLGHPGEFEFVSPRNQTEERIAEIFLKVLGVARVGANDDFFDLGGHSLTATRTIMLLNAEFGTALPVRVLFQAHTVSQLAEVVDKQDASRGDDWPLLIPIQPSGTRPPLFCVARPNVNALGYLFLSRELGNDQPVFGLQVQLVEDPELDFTDEQLRTTATEYIRAMKTAQPHGPYNFVGLCQGAYIAFEMVRQLEAANEVASFLGILDTWPDENTRYRALFFADVALKRLRKLDGRTIRRAIEDIRARGSHPNVPVVHTITPVESVQPKKMTMVQKYWPGEGFHPPMCSCAITVFKVRKQFWFRKKDEMLGWRDRTHGGVTVKRIPGDHETLLRQPHVRQLAALIAVALDGASRNGH